MSDIEKFVNLSLEELKKSLPKTQPVAQKLLAVNVNYQKCNGDCRFCGWNRNEFPINIPHPRLTSEILEREILFAKNNSATVELMNSTTHSSLALLEFLKTLRKDFGNMGFYPCICTKEILQALKDLNFSHICTNLEMSKNLFAKFISSHFWEGKKQTILNAKKIGLKVHSGILIGLGETKEDLIEIFSVLRDLHPDGLNLNFFYPESHLKLSQGYQIPSPQYSLKTLYQMRLIFPEIPIFLGAGQKEWLGENLSEAIQIAGGQYIDHFINQTL